MVFNGGKGVVFQDERVWIWLHNDVSGFISSERYTYSCSRWSICFNHNLNNCFWSSRRGAGETNPTGNHEVTGLIPGLAQQVKDLALP